MEPCRTPIFQDPLLSLVGPQYFRNHYGALDDTDISGTTMEHCSTPILQEPLWSIVAHQHFRNHYGALYIAHQYFRNHYGALQHTNISGTTMEPCSTPIFQEPLWCLVAHQCFRNHYGALYETNRVKELPTFWEFIQWFLLKVAVLVVVVYWQLLEQVLLNFFFRAAKHLVDDP